MSNTSICPIDRTLSGANTLGNSGPGCNGREGILRISPNPQHYWSLAIRLFCVILEPWGMWSIPSMPLLPGPLKLGLVIPVRVTCFGHRKFNFSIRIFIIFIIYSFFTSALTDGFTLEIE